MNHPKVSVIMPVYNAEENLAESIQSILNQSFADFEFLVFNDGSTDDSAVIIEKFAKSDSRITFFNYSQNLGYIKRLNEGIKTSKGKYIARMDSDDISHQDRFYLQFKKLEANPKLVVCGSSYQNIGTKKGVAILPTTNTDIKLKLLSITPFCHPSVLIRKSILTDHAIYYDEKSVPFEDFELWTRLAMYGEFHNISKVLLFYRNHNNNISQPENRTIVQRQRRETLNKNYLKKIIFAYPLSYDLLNQMFRKKVPFSLNELYNLSSNITKVKLNQYFQNQISQNEFQTTLRTHFFETCTSNTRHGLPLFFLYLKSKMTIKSFELNFLFFIKALFFYQKNK